MSWCIHRTVGFTTTTPTCSNTGIGRVVLVYEGASSVKDLVVGDSNPALDYEPSIRGIGFGNAETPLSAVSMNESAKSGWMERARQLYEFHKQHGHTLVPKRYRDNPALGNWVNKQRQQYRNYMAGNKPCALTDSRVEILNRINFCWDTTKANITGTYDEHQWWLRFEELRLFCLQVESDGAQSTSLLLLPRQTRLGVWLDRQRKIYLESIVYRGNNTTRLHEKFSEAQIAALSDLDPDWWMSRRQWQWEKRFRELQNYAALHGDCCVPISYFQNKLLANWVSNQRKQYNLRMAGKPSDLTDDRFQRLEAIGFVWNRWEYEFDKKEVECTHS